MELDRRIKLVNEYLNRLTSGKVKELVETQPGVFRIDFRSGTAKLELTIFQKEDILYLSSTLFDISSIDTPEQKYQLFEELLRLNSKLETMSAKFALSKDNFIEVIVARKDLKDLDYNEFLSMLKNVSNVADVIGGEISARYLLGKDNKMDITPLN